MTELFLAATVLQAACLDDTRRAPKCSILLVIVTLTVFSLTGKHQDDVVFVLKRDTEDMVLELKRNVYVILCLSYLLTS